MTVSDVPRTTDERSVQAPLAEVAERFGTPSYVYFLDPIVDRAREIAAAFGARFELSYAIKANPNRALLRAIEPHVAMLDASSSGELQKGLDCGYEANRITFSGPGKTRNEWIAALESGTKLVIESIDEAQQVDALCRIPAEPAEVLMRISPREVPPGFGINMAGRPTQFGFDEEELDASIRQLIRLKSIRLVGFHIFAGTQCLDGDSIAKNMIQCAEIFERCCAKHKINARWLVFGAGIGIPYHEGDEPVDLAAVGRQVAPAIDRLRTTPQLAGATCVLELGRYLVGQSGYFLTRVVRIKQSRGRQLCVLDGGLNHHLAACGHFGSVIHRNYPIWKVAGPAAADEAAERLNYDLCGPLCTTIDVLGRNVALPPLSPGDVIAVANSGAYGLTASPVHFISHRPPSEVLVSESNGKVSIQDITADGLQYVCHPRR